MMEIFHVEKGEPEPEELALLLVLIKDYEDKHIQISGLDSVEVIK